MCIFYVTYFFYLYNYYVLLVLRVIVRWGPYNAVIGMCICYKKGYA